MDFQMDSGGVLSNDIKETQAIEDYSELKEKVRSKAFKALIISLFSFYSLALEYTLHLFSNGFFELLFITLDETIIQNLSFYIPFYGLTNLVSFVILISLILLFLYTFKLFFEFYFKILGVDQFRGDDSINDKVINRIDERD